MKTWPRSGSAPSCASSSATKAKSRSIGIDSAVHRNQRASFGHDLLLAGDQGDLVRALQLHHPVVDLARQQAQREADHAGSNGRTSARPRDGSCRYWSGRGWPSARRSCAPRSAARPQSATFSAAWAAGLPLVRRACPLRRNAGPAGRFRNLTLTSFLHNPRHLPSGVRGGGIRSGREGWPALYQVSDIGVRIGQRRGRAARSTARLLPRAAARRPGLRQQGRGDCARPRRPISTSSSISASGSARANGFAALFDLRRALLRRLVAGAAASSRSPAPRRRRSADAQFEEARALAIAPLAYGADTGRRMAPTDAVEPLAESPERPIIDLRATFGRGDGFARVLERAGVAAAEADQVAALIGGAVPLDDIRPGTVMDLTLGRRPNRTRRPPARPARLPRPLRPHASSSSRADGALALTQIPIAVDETPLAHPGPGRRQPLPLGARRRRAGAGGRGLYPRAQHPGPGAVGHRFRRPLRHHHRASPRRHRRGRDRAAALCRPRPRLAAATSS